MLKSYFYKLDEEQDINNIDNMIINAINNFNDCNINTGSIAIVNVECNGLNGFDIMYYSEEINIYEIKYNNYIIIHIVDYKNKVYNIINLSQYKYNEKSINDAVILKKKI